MSSLGKLFPKSIQQPSHDDPRHLQFDWGKQRQIRMVVSPDLAKEWFEDRNRKNRDFKPLHAMTLACEMLEGRWKFNGDTIRFDYNGQMNDGQHRLYACFDSGVPMDALLVFGLEPEAMYVTDINSMPRGAGDQGKLLGLPNYNQATAAAKLVDAYSRHGAPKFLNSQMQPSATRSLEVALEDWGNGSGPMKIQAAIKSCNGIGTKLGISGSLLACCYVIFAKQSETRCEIFFESLASGVTGNPNSAVHRLRERLVLNKGAKSRLVKKELLALMFKAWKMHTDGKQCKTLRWQSGSEDFPQI